MGHGRRAVHAVGAILEKAMEMHTGCFVTQGVVDIGNDSVTLGEIEDRDGPLPVDADDWPWIQTVRVGSHPSDTPIVGQNCSAGRCQVKGKCENIGQHLR